MSSRPVVAGTAALVGFAALCVPFASVPLPGFGALVPTVIVITAVAQAATAMVLLAIYRRAPRRSIAVLAAVFAAGTIVSLTAALTVPIGPPPRTAVVSVSRQVAVWLYLLYHLGFPVCAFVYARARRGAEPELSAVRARAYVWKALGAITGGATALTLLVLVLNERLPVVVGPQVAYFRSTGLGVITFGLLLVAALDAMRRAGKDDPIDTGLALALLATALDAALHLVDDHRYVLSWYAARVLMLGGSSFVLVTAVGSLLSWRERALQLEGMLLGESQRADRHGRRLAVLWKVASTTTTDHERFLQALLTEAAHALSDRGEFMGTLSHVEGGEAVLDFVALDDGSHGESPFVPGLRAPAADLILNDVLRAGQTRSWADVHRDPRVAGLPGVAGSHFRSYAGTPFTVGTTTYVLAFASRKPLAQPLSWEDNAYIETVASFCSMRLHQRAQFDRLRHQSMHDAMTGLPNRAAFRMQAGDVLGSGAALAIIVMDIDGFGEINDAIGAQQADLLLGEIAATLRAHASRGDLVGRLGGDSFGLLIRGAGGREAERRVSEIRSAFALLERAPTTASYGIVLAPQDGSTVDRLLARADSAVRSVKQRGGGGTAFFDARIEDAFARARRLQEDLAHALAHAEFELYFQPHVELKTGRVVGAEALIRWNHPERGLLLPAEFIPFAEEQGLLGEIGSWVLRETVRASHAWRAADPNFRVWFNLSAVELADPGLLSRVRELDGDLSGVGAEITETAAMRNVHGSMHTIAALREAGLRIALDDFGTGYSSLAHLKRLPIDVVKIDQSFTQGLPGDAHDVAIVEAVISLAERYGFETVAEGVETHRQAHFLAAAGCRIAQGFVYARPMPAQAFGTWLLKHAATA